MTYATDNRWSPGASGATVPDDAPAAYSARWINYHGGTADIVPDRQGFAYNDPADRAALIGALMAADNLIRKVGDHDFDVTYEVNGGVEGLRVFQRRAGGYVYVDAWLVP